MVTSPSTWLSPTSVPGLSNVTVSQCMPQDGLVDDLLKAFGPDLQVLSRSTIRDPYRLEPRAAEAVALLDLARLGRHPVHPPSPGRTAFPRNRHSILRIVDARPLLGLDPLLTIRTALPWLRGHELWVPRALLHDVVGAAWAQLEREVAQFGGRLTPYDLELFERRSRARPGSAGAGGAASPGADEVETVELVGEEDLEGELWHDLVGRA